jgi:hypothetical protein
MKSDFIRSGYDDSRIKEILPDDIVECGFLGDQYRFSIWGIEGYTAPRQLYEDHSYIRKTANEFTGSVGRDAAMEITNITDTEIIASISDKSSKDAYAKTTIKIPLDRKILGGIK